MKKLIYLLPLLFVLHCTGQTKEEILNQCGRLIDTGSNSFYMLDAAHVIHDIGSRASKNLSALVPDSIRQQLLNNYLTDTATEKWNCNIITSGKCLEENSAPPASYFNHKPYTYKHVDQNGSTVRETISEIYSFSKPVYDNNHLYALLLVTCDKLGSSEKGLFALKKENNKWTVLGKLTGIVIKGI